MKNTLITIFGGTGFVGQYVVKELAKTGALIRVASRNPDKASHLRTMGSPGQISFIQANIRNKASVEVAVKGADVVINLVGLLFESGKQNFSAIHAQAAETLAKIAKVEGVKRLVHMSALGVDHSTHSKYARTKFNGENAILAAFPEASIMRPSIIFGAEDKFFNRFAAMAKCLPFLPLIGGDTKFQPVYVVDVAKAFAAVVADDATAGNIYELGGPDVYTFRELMQIMLEAIGKEPALIPVPFFLASIEAAFLELLPRPLLTRDQVQLLKKDNVVVEGANTFKTLGVEPSNLQSVIPSYLERYKAS